MPEASIEARTVHAVKIAGGRATSRHGLLFIGGVHAREIVNPDLLVSFALKLCQAYTTGSGLTFGAKSYSSDTVQIIVNALDIFILPLVNPDGRVYVQSPTGDPWWRKNRNPNPGLPCKGVDINRNYDFLWSSGIGTSADSCSDIFKGNGAFSEPETRNVRHMLDNYANVDCLMDVHSYMQLVLYPWGDDDDETSNASMNFMNPSYNGLRGTPGDSIYREYIPPQDLSWFNATGNRIRDAIAGVRGTLYRVEQSVLLYPTSGTSDDYSYSRHFVNASERRVYAYTLETGLEFQPTYTEALNIITEASAGLMELCIACICVVEETARGTALIKELKDMRAFRDQELLASEAGKRYVQLLEENTAEILDIMRSDENIHRRTADVLHRIYSIVQSRQQTKPQVFDAELAETVDNLLQSYSKRGSRSLKSAIAEFRRDLGHFRSNTVEAGLASASKGKRSADQARKSAARSRRRM